MTDYDLYLRFDFSKIRHLLHIFYLFYPFPLSILVILIIFIHLHSFGLKSQMDQRPFLPLLVFLPLQKKGQSLRINHSFSVSFCGFFSFHKHSSDRTFSFSPMISFKTAHFSKAFSLLWLFLVMIKTRAFITLPVLSSQKRKEENYEPTRNLQTCLYPP